jgi:hypothetical protein
MLRRSEVVLKIGLTRVLLSGFSIKRFTMLKAVAFLANAVCLPG